MTVLWLKGSTVRGWSFILVGVCRGLVTDNGILDRTLRLLYIRLQLDLPMAHFNHTSLPFTSIDGPLLCKLHPLAVARINTRGHRRHTLRL